MSKIWLMSEIALFSGSIQLALRVSFFNLIQARMVKVKVGSGYIKLVYVRLD